MENQKQFPSTHLPQPTLGKPHADLFHNKPQSNSKRTPEKLGMFFFMTAARCAKVSHRSTSSRNRRPARNAATDGRCSGTGKSWTNSSGRPASEMRIQTQHHPVRNRPDSWTTLVNHHPKPWVQLSLSKSSNKDGDTLCRSSSSASIATTKLLLSPSGSVSESTTSWIERRVPVDCGTRTTRLTRDSAQPTPNVGAQADSGSTRQTGSL